MRRTYILCLMVGILTIMASCDKEESPDGNYQSGVLITSEGLRNNNDGSISYFDKKSNTMVNNLFFEQNSRDLGDVVQSVAVAEGKAFIVVNNSKKMEVVDLKDFKSIGVITNLSYPRYFLGVTKTKGYLTNGGFPGELKVIDMENILITKTIEIGNQPEKLIKVNNKVFVVNGKWGADSTVSVIDINTDEVIKTINVGHGTNDLVEDANGKVWVLCQGKVVYDSTWVNIIEETDSKIVRINPDTYEVELNMIIGQTGDYYNPQNLAIDPSGTTIYFDEAFGVNAMRINATEPPTLPLINKGFYGLEIDPENGDIYGLDAGLFTTAGYLYRYKNTSVLIDTFQVGIGPNCAVFY